jgi:tRNA pseudouridine38-40 synthase
MADERHIKLVVEYDGTDFSGWQRQAPDRGPTIQGAIEAALARMCGHPVTLRGAGRTDAGVHARGQVAAFVTTSTIPLFGFVRGLNTALPRSIAIVSAETAPIFFDPRRWASGKHYVYQVWNRDTRAALVDRFAWHIHHPLALAPMQAAAEILVGEHDFSAFRAADCDRKNPVRTMRRLEVSRTGEGGAMLRFDLEATAFLKHMVRAIVGTLVDVGLGRRTPASMATLLASKDRRLGGRTAPPHGLCLEEVFLADGPVHRAPKPAEPGQNHP